QKSFCVAAILRSECPLWVKSRHQRMSASCPLYPQKRTLELSRGMSALCQKRTADRHLPAAGGQAVRDIIAASGDETQRRDGGSLRQPGFAQAVFVSGEIFRTTKRKTVLHTGNAESRIQLMKARGNL